MDCISKQQQAKPSEEVKLLQHAKRIPKAVPTFEGIEDTGPNRVANVFGTGRYEIEGPT